MSSNGTTAEAPEHFDVLIVGAGISGIGAACHLEERCPAKSYAILEMREAMGGTWDLFRYPGIRSDSDMYTLGFRFRPWTDAKAIADGPAILDYVRDTAHEHGVEGKIRYGTRVVRIEWSSEEALWTVRAERGPALEPIELTCNFLLSCSGYFDYEEGYTPEFEGVEAFGGRIVHPQFWDQALDYDGKRVVVIGSGATAITLVPALAERAEHVTMLQRSPSYVVAVPSEDPIANLARRWLPERAAYALVRWKNVVMTMLVFALSRRRPGWVRRAIRTAAEKQLPEGYEIDTHFKPAYNPWDQRMCLDPDGDLFRAIRKGTVSVATDHIDAFTETGIRLRSGSELEADVIVTATGLNLLGMGGVEIVVDGAEVVLPETMTYRSLMLSGVPNFIFSIGYTNASWTLKCDLTSEFACRLINHMDAGGYSVSVAVNDDASVSPEPMIDFTSGYVQRSIDDFPKQGSKAPWRLRQNYPRDIIYLRHRPIEDEALRFSSSR